MLKGQPDVVDVLVVGIPDKHRGAKGVAVFQPRPSAALDLTALQDHVRPRLAGYKLPRDVPHRQGSARPGQQIRLPLGPGLRSRTARLTLPARRIL